MASHWDAVARIQLVLEWLLPVARAGGSLLDIGCASGYYSVAFAQAGGQATGVDISEAGVALARRRAEHEGVAVRCEFLQGDMRTLAVSDGAYDVVLMIEVLEHVREQPQALAEAARALRPGGLLVLTTPHALDRLPALRRLRYRKALTPEAAGVDLQRLDTNAFVAESGIPHEPYFHDAFTFEQLRALLPEDVEVVRHHSLYMPMPTSRVMDIVPRGLRRRLKDALTRGALASEDDQLTDTRPTPDEPLAVPLPGANAALLVTLSKLMWRVPILRMAGYHHLLVARKSGSTSTTRSHLPVG